MAREARLLLRAARGATLATSADGHPFASLVTPATAGDGSLLLLLSELSEHTKHLRADGRCTVMAVGPAADANPQTAPRVSVSGTAVVDPDPALRARWVALHPYAAFYAGFADFHLWRLVPETGLIVAGFGRARSLSARALRPDPEAAAAVAAAEDGILAHLNADHADALAAMAGAAGRGGEGWAAVCCDVDGIDLARGEAEPVLRIPFPAPADGPAAVRTALVALVAALPAAALPAAAALAAKGTVADAGPT